MLFKVPKGDWQRGWLRNTIVRETSAYFEDLLHPLVGKNKLYFTSEVIKSMLDMPVPGSFQNIGH